MNNTHKKHESGQILVFVVLFVIGLFAMLALVLDGGNTYAKRRAAQNAADAGALAGARTLCMTKDSSLAVSVAQDYATNKNESDTADVNIDGDGYVTVNTSITFDTFFAHLIGRPQMTAEAQAVAGCFPPSSGSVLPIAWACKDPGENSEGDYDCDEKIVTEDQLLYYVKEQSTPPQGPDPFHTETITSTIWPEMYIIMNDIKIGNDKYVTPVCAPEGDLNCDLSGDHKDDLMTGGDRGWLDLTGGGGGAAELKNWINGTEKVSINVPVWTDGQGGADTSVFIELADQLDTNHYFTIPVFNAICEGYPYTICPGLYPNDENPPLSTAIGPTYYHVVGFVYFYVTCVSKKSDCPGNEAALDYLNTQLDILGINQNISKLDTIEGYFVEGIPSNLSGGDPNGLDTGVYTLRLYK